MWGGYELYAYPFSGREVNDNRNLLSARNNKDSSLGEVDNSDSKISDWFGEDIRRWERFIIQHYSQDPNLIAAIMYVESRGDPTAVSVAGAIGLLQVMPFHVDHPDTLFDPETNIRVGSEILTRYISETDLLTGVRAYNTGVTGATVYNRGWDYLELVSNAYRAATGKAINE